MSKRLPLGHNPSKISLYAIIYGCSQIDLRFNTLTLLGPELSHITSLISTYICLNDLPGFLEYSTLNKL